MTTTRRLLPVLVSLIVLPRDALADSVADFYKGNQISIFVSSAPGGGYDNYARMLSRHLGRHIPGSPSIVVKNMPGAGGARAANHVYNVAPKDGTAVVMPQNTLTIDQFTSTPSVKFDMRKFEWIGSMNVNQSVCLFSKGKAPASYQDLFSRKFILGASGGVTSSLALVPTLLNHLAGTKFEVINGYDGTNVVFLAMERGEVEGFCGIGWDSVRVQAGERIKRGELVIGLDVGVTPDSELKAMGVPFALGLMTEGQEKQTLALIMSVQLYGRPFAMPPGTPKDRVDAVRQAFAETIKDEAFVRDTTKANIQIQYAAPGQILEYINAPFSAPQPIQNRALAELRKAGWGGGAAQ